MRVRWAGQVNVQDSGASVGTERGPVTDQKERRRTATSTTQRNTGKTQTGYLVSYLPPGISSSRLCVSVRQRERRSASRDLAMESVLGCE